jgi:hypothetical protein
MEALERGGDRRVQALEAGACVAQSGLVRRFALAEAAAELLELGRELGRARGRGVGRHAV